MLTLPEVRPATTIPPMYVGLVQIGQRLHASRTTILEWHKTRGLPMYHRRVGPRWCWVSSESLILAWEVVQVRLSRRQREEPRPAS